ncbi:MFS transporter [Bacillus gobiensis]|uniref:MFS transporter n=1 Tax=Bacillus gobiensis TaxID=1441095 RepID=UPI003D1A2A7D
MDPKLNDIHTNMKLSSIWQNQNFVLLWMGTSLSNFTFHIFRLALPLIVYDLTKSTFSMGTMKVIEILPNILFGMIVGVIVDRINRKRVILGAIGIQVLILGAIIILIDTETLQMWHLYLLGFALYTCGYTFGNAYHTVLPLLVNKKQLTSANATLNFLETFIDLVGPAFAGFILFSMDYKIGLTVTVIGLFSLLIFSYFIKVPVEKPKQIYDERKSIWSEMKEGWQHLVEVRSLWLATLMILNVNIATGASSAILVFYAVDSLALSEYELGIVFSGTAIGGMLGSLVAKKSLKWCKRGYLFLYALIGLSLGQLINFMSTNWYTLMLGMFFIGLFGVTINIHYFTIRQESTPNYLLGRVAGTSSMLMKMAAPISFLTVGVLGEIVPVNYVFIGSSLLLLLLTICFFNTSLRYIE